jgi:hypothetical protein
MFDRPKDQQDYVLSKPLGVDQVLPEFTYYQLSNEEVPLVDINEVSYSMKVVTALMNLALPKETKRTRERAKCNQ